MRGAYRIQVSTKKVRYDFVVRRNITIIQGDSGTGKTTLISLIQRFNRAGISGVTLKCEKMCRVISDDNGDWEDRILAIKDSIIFLDETEKFVATKEFVRILKQSDNYFVIITREPLKSLPYSVDEIYGFRTDNSRNALGQVYNELYHIYGQYASASKIQPTLVITEDSKTGFEFFKKVCDKARIKCLSGEGRDCLVNLVIDRKEKVLIIADGAAFGCAMRAMMKVLDEHADYTLYLPESFEWLLLKSGVIKDSSLPDILEHTSDYVESTEYISWERFFTWLLGKLTLDNPYVTHYSKIGKVPKAFLADNNIEKVLQQMPDRIVLGK